MNYRGYYDQHQNDHLRKVAETVHPKIPTAQNPWI